MTLEIQHTFVDGTKAKASEVNENFTACKDAINTNTSDIATANSTIAGHTTAIGTNTTAIGTLASLTTNEKSNLVGAVNEVNAKAYHQREKLPTLSNNVSDANNDIDITAGYSYDVADSVLITNGALTKRLDASWSAGTNQGGLDAGSKAISTWYHLYVISKADGTTDALFSTSATAPTMPTDYIYKRRIGSVKTDASGNIIQFFQDGDYVYWKTAILDYSGAGNATAQTLTISTPLGVLTKGLMGGSQHTDESLLLFNVNQSYVSNDTWVYNGINKVCTIGGGVNGQSSAYVGIGNNIILTNTSSQIKYVTRTTGAIAIFTYGYIDSRGKN